MSDDNEVQPFEGVRIHRGNAEPESEGLIVPSSIAREVERLASDGGVIIGTAKRAFTYTGQASPTYAVREIEVQEASSSRMSPADALAGLRDSGEIDLSEDFEVPAWNEVTMTRARLRDLEREITECSRDVLVFTPEGAAFVAQLEDERREVLTALALRSLRMRAARAP